MKLNKFSGNPFLLFSPFLLIYSNYILLFPSEFNDDDLRYLQYARNLVHGFYSPPAPDIQLINGPGYPLVISPLVALELPLIYIALLNAMFYYLSIITLFTALKEIVSVKVALIFSVFWACYYVAFQNLNAVMTETFTFLLVSLLILTLVRAFKSNNLSYKYTLLGGFIFGYIVLTKMIFGYVLMIMVLGFFFLWISDNKNINYRRGILILVMAFSTVSPYLIYTFHLTGRVFYWGSGSESLYWMSSPYKGEYGDYKGSLTQGTVELGNYNIPGAVDSLLAHHSKDYEEIYQKEGIEWDDAYKEKAISNIKAHPFKYMENVLLNTGRLIFHYPFSYAIQRPKILLIFPINGIIFSLMIFCMFLTIINWKRMSFAVIFLLIFCFLYLGLCSLITAFVRMFTIIVPVLLFWFAYILSKSIVINKIFADE